MLFAKCHRAFDAADKNRVTKSQVAMYGLLIVAMMALSACSTAPVRDAPEIRQTTELPPDQSAEPTLGDELALRAIAQVGKPYRYGGADLKGFDCSGLVFYVHQDLGVQVPRTAAEQYKMSKPVNIHQLLPGDLLFFRTTRSKRVTHVGVYAGGGRFVHAPQTGEKIEIRELSDEYYGKRLVGAGRLYHGG
jgi:murein DD-endopeptidase